MGCKVDKIGKLKAEAKAEAEAEAEAELQPPEA